MKNGVLIVVCLLLFTLCTTGQTFPIKTITEKGAWCWFADPRAIHYENESGTINSTFIGYIDINGNIKATQIDYLNKRTSEVMIRSYFQPDDHNNPTFLVLHDERIMVFYTRHTDEPCFYYRVSKKPGDITTLGKEMKLETTANTTYPSPFILSDDKEHIYLTWRGINWHPTIARLTIPDGDDNVEFNWGPFQIVQSQKGESGVRPYAKYASNGKDKIYLAYTTTHPDNQSENWIYLNYFDINSNTLNDINGKQLSIVGEFALHQVNISSDYKKNHHFAVADDSPYRNWIWELSLDYNENPIMVSTSISEDKTSHDYYHIQWTGQEWQKTFISNAGGHFHQTPNIEKCYSAGLALDKKNYNTVYASVPVKGEFGEIYEIVKFSLDGTKKKVNRQQLTYNSRKNNVRPFMIEGTPSNEGLVWMQGDYYDWIVSKQRPEGYPTSILSNIEIPKEEVNLLKGLIEEEKERIYLPNHNSFTISADIVFDNENSYGEIIHFSNITYTVPKDDLPRPYIKNGEVIYESQNVLGNSDSWKEMERSTNGIWYPPKRMQRFNLTITCENGIVKTYINGLIDQSVYIENLSLKEITEGNFDGNINNIIVYDRLLNQKEIKLLQE